MACISAAGFLDITVTTTKPPLYHDWTQSLVTERRVLPNTGPRAAALLKGLVLADVPPWVHEENVVGVREVERHTTRLEAAVWQRHNKDDDLKHQQCRTFPWLEPF